MYTKTHKLYYDLPYTMTGTALVLSCIEDMVVLDKTLFFPEGGGQIGSIGWLKRGDHIYTVRDCTKRGGTTVFRPALPVVNVETEVLHLLTEPASPPLQPGDEVEMHVDEEHRARCRRHHSGLHPVLTVLQNRLGHSLATAGCFIDAEHARLDFRTDQKLTPELLAEVEAAVNGLIAEDLAVEMLPVEGVPEMFIWHVVGRSFLDQPCGGTHVRSLREIGCIALRRRRLGRGQERVYLTCVTE